jgi:hypothetical protein
MRPQDQSVCLTRGATMYIGGGAILLILIIVLLIWIF